MKKKTSSSEHAMNKLREHVLTEHCGLISNDKKVGVDALHHIDTYATFELKWIGHDRTSINTKTPLTLENFTTLRNSYWIVGEEKFHDDNYNFVPKINKIWINHPAHLAPILDKIEQRLLEKRQLHVDAITALEKTDLDRSKIAKIDELLKSGTHLINPKIPLKEFIHGAVELNPTDSMVASDQVIQFIQTHPLQGYVAPPSPTDLFAFEFFDFC